MSFWTYILASQRNGTLYVGSTDNLAARMEQHKIKAFGGFTAKYGVTLLVWYEQHGTREAAFRRERRIKKWNRAWKLALIERFNPGWHDLLDSFTGTVSDAEAEVSRFIGALQAQADSDEQKSLGPRLRGDERKLGDLS